MSTPWVLHVDLDQFIAAVEVLRRPELAGRPVIVGGRGDPTERAVVSTASYEARALGVGSGMPLRIAARKAPEAVLLPVDGPAYTAASEHVMAALREVPDDTGRIVVEVLGWDEAFLGVTTADPEALAHRVRAAVLAATGLHSSVGIGDTKVRAKIATGFGKPQGVFRLTRDNWFEVMGTRPTIDLWGVGSKVSKRLAAHGIVTVERARPRRHGGARRGVRAADGPVVRRARQRHRLVRRRRHPVDRPGPQPGDDLPAQPHDERAGRGRGPRAGAGRCSPTPRRRAAPSSG